MNMLRSALIGLAAGLALSAGATASFAADSHDQPAPPRVSWSFAGPFGTFDRAQLQRGFKIYREVCAGCHSINLLRFRNLAEPGGPEFSKAQVEALAAEYKIKDGPNEQGEMFERPGRAADNFPAPFANEQAARSANGGALPPDFSVIAKARTYTRGFPWFVFDVFTQFQEQGPDYIAALLTGYDKAPEGMPLLAGQYYNTYMNNHLISMPQPLQDGQVEFPKTAEGKPQVPETVAQYSKDIAAFLVWAAEPHMEARKRIGWQAMVFLLMLGGLLYFTKKKIWGRLPEHAHGH